MALLSLQLELVLGQKPGGCICIIFHIFIGLFSLLVDKDLEPISVL